MLAAAMAVLHQVAQSQRLTAPTPIVMILLQVPKLPKQAAPMAVAMTHRQAPKYSEWVVLTAAAVKILLPPKENYRFMRKN